MIKERLPAVLGGYRQYKVTYYPESLYCENVENALFPTIYLKQRGAKIKEQGL